jgi:hypothetical protein
MLEQQVTGKTINKGGIYKMIKKLIKGTKDAICEDKRGIQTIETLVIAAMGVAIAILGITFLRSGGNAAGSTISSNVVSAVKSAGSVSSW